MKNVFVLADLALATSKELSALGVGEIGAFGVDTDNVWKPVAASTTAKLVGFAIGNGTAAPYRTPMIQTAVKNYGLSKAVYAADVEATLTGVVTVTGYTADALDQITLTIESESPFDNDSKAKETFTVVGKGTKETIHTALKDKINEQSKNFTAVVTGTGGVTNFVVTAKNSSTFLSYKMTAERYDGASTPLPTMAFTVTAPTIGAGTPAKVKQLVEAAIGHLGNTETTYTYDSKVPRQAVNGSKYTTLTFQYTEDKPTEPTRNTHFPLVELVFACDVTATTPSTLVDDLETFIGTVFGA
jgi:hypothetical protein